MRSTPVMTALFATLAERRFVAALAQELARSEQLNVLTDQLVRSDRFLRGVVDSSTFTSQLTRSDRVVNGLTDNSSFISKLKARLAR